VHIRVANIFHHIKKQPDLILIKNAVFPYIDTNFFYVTGLTYGLFEGALAVLHPAGDIDLFVSTLEAEAACKADATVHVYKDKAEFETLVKQTISASKTIGINFNGISHQDFLTVKKLCSRSKFIDVSSAFTKTRLIKDTKELNAIRKACHVSDVIMKKIPDMLSGGMHEYELAAEINYRLQHQGADKPAFDTISSFGKHTAEPHYSPGETRLQPGDIVLCDFGACVDTYNSDITRAFIFGKATRKLREIHRVVCEAQTVGLELIRPGVKACDVHAAVAKFIDSTRFKGCFIHSTGHSLGLDVHDGPGLTPDNTMILKENMVFTVEPGVYIPGFGGVRIEDDVVVKKNGVDVLSAAPREFLEL
jgi:Xaa-Pro dipeptidase